jgi:hypothetical protein
MLIRRVGGMLGVLLVGRRLLLFLGNFSLLIRSNVPIGIKLRIITLKIQSNLA